jgi:TDG/mug DNA glycosylase family protein
MDRQYDSRNPRPDPGLDPVSGPSPRVLILGSFPSRLSLAGREYYGNPRNQFWRIMEDLFSIKECLPYPERIGLLTARGIALWDVVASCSRTGSSDAKIRSPVFNNIPAFLVQHPGVRLIAFNGAAARKFFDNQEIGTGVDLLSLPSTSPAHAILTIREKTDRWRVICDYLEHREQT